MIFVSLALSAALLASPSFASNVTEEIVFQDHVRKVDIAIDEGGVILKKSSGQARVAYSPSRNNCRMDLSVKDGVLRIRNNLKEGGCPCHYELYVPCEIEKTNITMGSDSIFVSDLKSKFSVNFGNGSIRFDKTEGDIELNMGDGELSYLPAKSSILQKLSVSAGNLKINCAFPNGTTIAPLPKYTFMADIKSRVKQSASTYDYILSGALGDGEIDLTYDGDIRSSI